MSSPRHTCPCGMVPVARMGDSVWPGRHSPSSVRFEPAGWCHARWTVQHAACWGQRLWRQGLARASAQCLDRRGCGQARKGRRDREGRERRDRCTGEGGRGRREGRDASARRQERGCVHHGLRLQARSHLAVRRHLASNRLPRRHSDGRRHGTVRQVRSALLCEAQCHVARRTLRPSFHRAALGIRGRGPSWLGWRREDREDVCAKHNHDRKRNEGGRRQRRLQPEPPLPLQAMAGGGPLRRRMAGRQQGRLLPGEPFRLFRGRLVALHRQADFGLEISAEETGRLRWQRDL
mmetsp:Transcript_106690/g.299779  ORF Transcript_106690/g.299779 Transcript_106690/m.299779 type:complete len:292 (-) Transcript_106690:378-1253(-)